MKSAMGYCRVSTEDQASDGVSLSAQQAKIEAWCILNDYQLRDVFVDAGMSGGRADNRPGLQCAIKSATESKSALIVYSLSRLARSTKDTIIIGEQLDKAGADLVSLSEKIDTTTAAGKMVFRMLAVLAEFERDQVSERTRLAMDHKKSCNERVGTIPYGFDLENDGTTLIPNSQEQETIAIIRELRARGLSLRSIASELQLQGRLTKKGHEKWTHTAVQSIIHRIV